MTCRLRWAGPDDYPAIRTLAAAWFPAEILIDAGLYRRLLERGSARVRILERDSRPAGYYALWPLTAPAYADLRRGARHENDLDADDMVAPTDGRARALYVSDVCVAPRGPDNANGAQPGHVLLRDLQRTLVDLLSTCPHIARVAAWAFSADGAQLAGRLGLDPVAPVPGLVEISEAALRRRLALRRDTRHTQGTPEGRQE